VKILMIDDHHLVREGMRPLLQRLADGGEAIEVLDAATFKAGLEMADAHPDVDLVLLDLNLPDAHGASALSQLQSRHRGVPVVVVSGEDDPALVRGIIEQGALGFIPKSSSPQVILNALRLVLSGGTYLPLEVMAAGPAASATGSVTAQAGSHARITSRLNITPRQADVLQLLVEGKSNKQICRELDLAEGTVKNHIAAVFKALNVTTRVQAVIAAGKLGIKS
jgi:DNA-binding NarL/FixJ family response regulator